MIPAICCVLGALIYGISNNPKVTTLARDMFWCDLLAFLLTGAHLFLGSLK